MNTTPIISNRSRVSYTAVGGRKPSRIRRERGRLCILLLNRGGRFFRTRLFKEIEALGLGEIICCEGPRVPYDIEELSRQFPAIRFLLLQEETSIGEKINIGMEESAAPLVLVLWSDMRVVLPAVSARAARAVKQQEPVELLEELAREGPLCSVPLLKNAGGMTLPSIQIPVLIKDLLKLAPWAPLRDGMQTLVPFEFCGLYRKDKFTASGGFDRNMSNPYWQKIDFGLRAYLWGERILYNQGLQMVMQAEVSAEDTTADESYRLFYLKNLAVRFQENGAVLPYTRLPHYLVRSDLGPVYSGKEFREVRKWVEQNRHRFITDAQTLVKNWETPE
jgi:GT2 family glycosyltransferase